MTQKILRMSCARMLHNDLVGSELALRFPCYTLFMSYGQDTAVATVLCHSSGREGRADLGHEWLHAHGGREVSGKEVVVQVMVMLEELGGGSSGCGQRGERGMRGRRRSRSSSSGGRGGGHDR